MKKSYFLFFIMIIFLMPVLLSAKINASYESEGISYELDNHVNEKFLELKDKHHKLKNQTYNFDLNRTAKGAMKKYTDSVINNQSKTTKAIIGIGMGQNRNNYKAGTKPSSLNYGKNSFVSVNRIGSNPNTVFNNNVKFEKSKTLKTKNMSSGRFSKKNFRSVRDF